MDLHKLTPKDKLMYETAMESKEVMLKRFGRIFSKDKYDEIAETIYFISRAEYKRGKADGK